MMDQYCKYCGTKFISTTLSSGSCGVCNKIHGEGRTMKLDHEEWVESMKDQSETKFKVNKFLPSEWQICTPTERAFLDEIREKGKWHPDNLYGYSRVNVGDTKLYQSDFKANLQELVNE
jgi:hypothetical protein